MATEVERLVVSLEASITKYERAMQRALGQANTTTSQIERRFKRMTSTLDVQLAGLGRSLAAPFLGAAAVQGFQRLLDANTRIENSLKTTGLAGEELATVYDRLFESAQRNAAPLETLTQLYSRAALVQNELGITSEELLGFTDKVALALRVSGQSAAESSGALLQLSQALGSGVVRAEEFNSVLEGALPIAQAAAAGLEEAGGSVAKLRQLIVDGKVSSEAFFRAFEAGSVILEDKVAGAAATTSQGFERVSNALIRAAGQLDEATGVSEALAGALDTLGWAVEQVGLAFEEWQGPIQDFIGLLGQAVNLIKLVPAIDPTRITREGTAALEQLAATQKPVEITVTGGAVEPVSLNNFAAPTKRGGSGGGGLSEAEKQAKAVRELVEELQFEQEQIGRTALQQEIMNELRRVGVDVMSAEGQQIAALISQNDALTASQESLEEAMQAVSETAKEALSGFISDIREGKSATEALANVFDRLADRAIEFALNAVFSGIGGGGGGIGNILGAIFGGKRAAGGPVSAGRAYLVGEKGPELMVPRMSGRIVPNGAMGGGLVRVAVDFKDEMLNARIVQTSGPVAAQITQAGIAKYDTRVAQRVNEQNARNG